VKGKQMNESTQAFFKALAAKAEVIKNREAEAKRVADFYALGVERMNENRAVK
jgi:hypothetical protein